MGCCLAKPSNGSLESLDIETAASVSQVEHISKSETTTKETKDTLAQAGPPPCPGAAEVECTAAANVETESSGEAIPKHKQRVIVNPINVGQGDAILLEVWDDTGNHEKILIDGGMGQTTTNKQFYCNLIKTLESHSCISKPAADPNLVTDPNQGTDPSQDAELTPAAAALPKPKEPQSQITIDRVVITHPDKDHYGGIKRLLEGYTVESSLIVTHATAISNGENKWEGNRYESNEHDLVQHWLHEGRCHDLAKEQILESITIGRSEEIKKDESNQSSILTTVKLENSNFDFDVVLTGDSYAPIIEERLKLNGKKIGIFQVPHHGSRNNSTHKKSNISVEDCAKFYSSFDAQVYFISHGKNDHYNHPHIEVITGIIKAAVTKKMKCKIIVTATWFHSAKIDDSAFDSEEERKKWDEYVDIYMYMPEASHVSLTPTMDWAKTPPGLQKYEHSHADRRVTRSQAQKKVEETPEGKSSHLATVSNNKSAPRKLSYSEETK